MIKFEFTVDEIDAENILRAVREQAIRSDTSIIGYMSDITITDEQREAFIGWHKRHKEYCLGLLDKMTNTRV